MSGGGITLPAERTPGTVFRRQHSIGRYVLDFTARRLALRSGSTGWATTWVTGRSAT
jgi:hypothetical protein